MNVIVTMRRITFLFMVFMILNISSSPPWHIPSASAAPGRWEKELSGNGWRLWLDSEADWKNDDIYLPPVNINALPVNPPTCGWDRLDENTEKMVVVPGTVEEHFWSANGNPHGIAGDFRGVSWWSRTFRIEPSLRGKRIIIAFESVNLRAEVFVNSKLVGYDVIGNTPFEVDATDAVVFDRDNRIDVRITDPVGNYDWNDEYLMRWGENMVPAVHGFGGITGAVFIRASDTVHVDDIYVQNKPNPKEAEVFVTIGNSSGSKKEGLISLVIHEWKKPSSVLWKKTMKVSIPSDGSELSFRVKAPDARLWAVREPNLYEAVVTFNDDEGSIADSMRRRFGFRFFTVGEKNGDKRFYLNGRRVFILAAMTRGFWPKNGIFPTHEMAWRDMKIAVDLGYNMMLYHRAIGQPISIKVADELGILTYEEPGGYMCNPGSDKPIEARMAPVPPVPKEWRREKLRRMMLRDRSVPSMSIWNIDDLSWLEPTEDDKKNIRMVHELDPSRPITFNCIIPAIVPNMKDNPFKLHMKPFDDNLYYHGWISPYHFASQAGYIDEYYKNPLYYLRYVLAPHSHAMGDSIHPAPEDEIIFYGEEGGYGTPLRLEKIKNELMRTGADGWREGEHLDWYNSYDRFLDETGFRSSFPTVDDLTMALGVNLHYFHGRIIENTRISNIADAYVLNGWASAGTHTDIVDTYRNPTADPKILQHYTRPLYVAVKIRDKVLPVGTIPVADIFIVNEKNLREKHTLALSFENPSGNVVFSESYKVNILGGEEFGQLLVENVRLPRVEKKGYYTLKAKITDRKNTVRATGFDDIFAVDYMNGPGIKGTVTVIDTSGAIKSFLKETRGVTASDFDPYGPDIDYIIIGKHDFNMVRSLGKSHVRGPDPIMTRVANGATLIVLDQADHWAELRGNINLYRALHYTGRNHLGDRGRLFAGKSNLLKDLPNSQSLNWEYQVFYSGDVWGLNIDRNGNETVVALAAQHNKDILTALSRIPFGNGQIILSTLNILPELGSEKYQSAVAKKLFLNLLEYSR